MSRPQDESGIPAPPSIPSLALSFRPKCSRLRELFCCARAEPTVLVKAHLRTGPQWVRILRGVTAGTSLGDWSIFRREDAVNEYAPDRKHGPVPLARPGGALFRGSLNTFYPAVPYGARHAHATRRCRNPCPAPLAVDPHDALQWAAAGNRRKDGTMLCHSTIGRIDRALTRFWPRVAGPARHWTG